MERELDFDVISDGKQYTANDLVKVGSDGCRGCSACCHGMGDTIVLDPLDVFWLERGLFCDFAALLEQSLSLRVVDGLVLPYLKMKEKEDCCSFLSPEGRCTIHEFRPGFCRMFPLGRRYENGTFTYFLQINECRKKNRTKMKVKKWMDVPDFGRYEVFVSDWHYALKTIQDDVRKGKEEAWIKEKSMQILQIFYLTSFEEKRDFYDQFYERLDAFQKMK